MTRIFRVVEDSPPHEALWAPVPSDEDDLPIWTTAVRAGAHVVVTENLKDGPPELLPAIRDLLLRLEHGASI